MSLQHFRSDVNKEVFFLETKWVGQTATTYVISMDDHGNRRYYAVVPLEDVKALAKTDLHYHVRKDFAVNVKIPVPEHRETGVTTYSLLAPHMSWIAHNVKTKWSMTTPFANKNVMAINMTFYFGDEIEAAAFKLKFV
jgi:hypothetical protein